MIGFDLPKEEFLSLSSKTPLINVDLFIVNELGDVLLSWRDDEHCGRGWHIPGGIIRHGETMMTRLRLTAERELGFVPEYENAPCKITEIFLEQKYRNHFISLLHKGRCKKIDVKTVAEHETTELVICVGLIIIQSLFTHRPHMISILRAISKIKEIFVQVKYRSDWTTSYLI